jgi:hypothetical protein
MPLDHCLSFSKNCGLPSADAYCKFMGYQGAQSFVDGPKVENTMTPSGETCEHAWAPQMAPFCGSFASVTCIR